VKALHTYYFCPRNFGMSEELITFAYPKLFMYESDKQLSKAFAANGAGSGNAPARSHE
jgi:hypothetical protein